MKFLFKKYIFIADVINNQSQYRIGPAGSCIPESLQVHHFPEWRIKEINNGEHQVSCSMYVLSHEEAK